MSSDLSREATGPERTGPDSSSTPESASRVDRLRHWLSRYTLHVEALLAAGSLGLGVLAVPIVIFGMFAALPSDAPPSGRTDPGTPILDAGAVVVAASLALLVALAVAVLVHGYAELRGRESPFADGLGALTAVYGGVRIVETLAAATVLLGLLTAVGSLLTLERVPESLGLLVGIAGLLLPVVVLVHAAGALVGCVLGVGRDDETEPATVG